MEESQKAACPDVFCFSDGINAFPNGWIHQAGFLVRTFSD
jgi:hypothetical protein